MQLGNFIDVFLSRHVTRHHPHRTHDLRSGSQDHHPSKNSVQKTICCNSTSNAPDDGRMYPKHVELRIHQSNYLVASSWRFTLFHEEDARSNNPQVTLHMFFSSCFVIQLYKRNQIIAQFYQLIFNFCCLLRFAKLVGSSSGRQL